MFGEIDGGIAGITCVFFFAEDEILQMMLTIKITLPLIWFVNNNRHIYAELKKRNIELDR